jgi:hypothetical protein
MSEQPYTLLQRADGDPAKAGELVAWHAKHIRETDGHTAVLEAAMVSEITDLTEQLEAAKLRLADHLQARDRQERWDAFNLLDWFLNAPENQHLKTKSVKLPYGYTVGSRAQKALLKIVDPAPIMTAMPECCELKLKDGEAKKGLAATEAGVVFASTGELVPEGSVEITRPEGEKYYLKRPDGTELELTMLWQAEEEAEDEDTTDDGADEHPTSEE